MSERAFGRPHRHFRVCGSTNDVAREMAAAGAPGGTVVTADEQTAGRGRRGRSWVAPAGAALLLSAVLRPLRLEHRLLPLAVPLAVCEAVEALAPVACRVKWPNDVWIEGRKCSGVLIEARPADGWAVIGVGLNLAIAEDEFPPDLNSPATSVGHGVGPAAARGAVCAALGRWTAAGEDEVLDGFRERDALRGRPVSWEDGEGTAAGVAADGNLLVETTAGVVSLGAGEVRLRVG